MTLTQKLIANLKGERDWAIVAGNVELRAEIESEITRLEVEEQEAMKNTDELVGRMK